MGCPPVCGLSYIQVAKHGINIFTTYISVDLAYHDIVRAKNGKGGIRRLIRVIGWVNYIAFIII